MDQNNIGRSQNTKRSGDRKGVGVILLVAGAIILAHKMGMPIPDWILTWPMILITVGLLVGVKSKFHNAGAYIMIAVGTAFLIDQSIPEINFHNYIFPVLLIAVGLMYILRPKKSLYNVKEQHPEQKQWDRIAPESGNSESYLRPENIAGPGDSSELVDINAVFGGVKKHVLSKNFKGGEINCFMGGSELNLIQADIQQPIVLEVNNVFGGTKLIVPSNWDVKIEVAAFFGGIEDKRTLVTAVADPGKILILKGACVFGGIEISNY